MPRNLPWLSGPSTSRSTHVKPKKVQKALFSDSDDDARPLPTKPELAPPKAGRTPSTSPPRAPLTEEYSRVKPDSFTIIPELIHLRLMHEGLDRDDIYIMVEDEFHAIAKTFTQHLHHAEYIRLKALAKTRNASAASTISRPVDSITAMRAETKKRKEAEARDTRNKAALEKLKNPAVQAQRQKSDSDFSDLDAEGRDDGRWKGTALQGLMTTSPRKNQTSLTGLQNVKSSTRAAAGFLKAENIPTPHSTKTFDHAPKPRPEKQTLQRVSESSTTEESDTDDLSAPAPRRHVPAPKPLPKSNRKSVGSSSPQHTKPTISSHSSKPVDKSNPSVSRPPFPLHKSQKSGSTTTVSKTDARKRDSSSDSSQPRASVRLRESEAARRRLKARMAARQERLGRKSKIEGNADEIPVFLV
ncbi:hypothetical protein MMC07_009138 [Pseudocyphellaria aurata]|nr:hypothetical protein [Pseudocyphellaria aurata]